MSGYGITPAQTWKFRWFKTELLPFMPTKDITALQHLNLGAGVQAAFDNGYESLSGFQERSASSRVEVPQRAEIRLS